jgi:DNA replication protein DnaC
MPKIFSEITFDDYKPQNKKAAEVKSRLIKYAENFEAIKEAGACALLIGNTGTGKSMLSAAVGNYIMNRGYTCFYTKCPRVINGIKDTWSQHTEGTQEQEINKYRKFDLVIIDEIPKGLKTQNDWELLHETAERRTDDRLPTISISTLSEKELRKKIGDEVFRRLHHRGHILNFDWETYKGEPVF